MTASYRDLSLKRFAHVKDFLLAMTYALKIGHVHAVHLKLGTIIDFMVVPIVTTLGISDPLS